MSTFKYLFAPVKFIRERPLLSAGIALGGLALWTGSVYYYKNFYQEQQQLPTEELSAEDPVPVFDDHEDQPSVTEEEFIAPAQQRHFLTPAGRALLRELQHQDSVTFFVAQSQRWLSEAGPMSPDNANLNGQVEAPDWQIVPYWRRAAPSDIQQTWTAHQLTPCREMLRVLQDLGRRRFLPTAPNEQRSQAVEDPAGLMSDPLTTPTRPVHFLTPGCQDLPYGLKEMDRGDHRVTETESSDVNVLPASQHFGEAEEPQVTEFEPAPNQTDNLPSDERNLPLMGTWWAYGWKGVQVNISPMQRWEDKYTTLIIVRHGVTEIWWSHVCHLDWLGPTNPLASSLVKEVTGIQIRDGVVQKLICFRSEKKADYDCVPYTPLAEVTTRLEGFKLSETLVNCVNWTHTHKFTKRWDQPEPEESPFTPPCPPSESESPSPPPPPGQWQEFERAKAAEESVAAEIPNIYAHQQLRGTENIAAKVAALRSAFKGENTGLFNYMTVAGRMILSGLAQLSNKDVQTAQFYYDQLLRCIQEQNRQELELQLADEGIHHVNLIDILFEFVLHRLLRSVPASLDLSSRPFFGILLELLKNILPEPGISTKDGRRYARLIQERMRNFVDTIFSLPEEVYQCPEQLEQQIQDNLESEVELLMDWLG